MPAKRDLDPGASPLHFFGAEVRRAREAAGMTLADLGATVPCDASTVSKIEAGVLHPTDRFLAACTETFPHLEWLPRFYRDSRTWGDSAVPRWFEDWLNIEGVASSLRIWQPLVIPGLLQTADYARALLRAGALNTGDESLDQLVAARLARQHIFDRPDPPNLWIVLGEFVLHRLIGTPKVTYDLVHLRPGRAGQHRRARGPVRLVLYREHRFYIASTERKPDVLHVDAVEGMTIERNSPVRKAAITFDLVRNDALTRNDPRDLILKVAEERWNT